MSESDGDAHAAAAQRGSVRIELVAGSVGGACQVLVGQPLDTIKTRAQTAAPGQFKGSLDILRQTIAKEGLLALYKGMASPLLGIAAVNSLLFTAYGVSKRLISPYPELSLGQIAMAGGMAGGANAILASPVELFKIKMQGQYGGLEDKKLKAVVADQYRQFGFRNGIMRGYWVTFLREIPAYAAFYTGYEFSKRHLSSPTLLGDGMLTYMTSGALGGVSYWLACYPLDVVKSRVQLARAPPAPVGGLGRFLGLGYVAREMATIVGKDGASALFRGLTPSLIRSVPAAASTFLAFEVTKNFITEHNLL